jgi:hypothetical protein
LICLSTLFHMCRDRASRNTENAIQQAHEDNHSGKAMEVLLRQAKDQGTAFCEGLPLRPSLDDVTKYLIQGQRRDAELAAAADGVPVAARRVRKTILDTRERGEGTFFLGLGNVMRPSDRASLPAMNAIGFFLYTRCEGNHTEAWPATMGAPRWLCAG